MDAAQANDLRRLGQAAFASGRHQEAEQLFILATQMAPQAALAHHDLGCFYKALGRIPEARERLMAAQRLDPLEPRIRHALGIVLLTEGRYAEGWPFYNARHEVPELRLQKPALPYSEWTGGPPDGRKILLFPEQGLGDQIQFARFARSLAKQGADVTLLCHPALSRLFENSLDVRVAAAAGRVDFPDPDVWAMTGSVAGLCAAGPQDVPAEPYLSAGAAARVQGRIGLVTRGNPAHTNDAHRSLPEATAARLRDLPGIISLHPEDTGARDMADTAEIVAALDLVITVDTSVAHLAGALGKPVWILLPRLMTDWRWMEGRTDSPWYPSARLYRQAEVGAWDSVVAEVVEDLAQL